MCHKRRQVQHFVLMHCHSAVARHIRACGRISIWPVHHHRRVVVALSLWTSYTCEQLMCMWWPCTCRERHTIEQLHVHRPCHVIVRVLLEPPTPKSLSARRANITYPPVATSEIIGPRVNSSPFLSPTSPVSLCHSAVTYLRMVAR